MIIQRLHMKAVCNIPHVFQNAGLTMLWLATLLPCVAETARPYHVGVLYGSDETVVAHWKAGVEPDSSGINLIGISYVSAAEQPDRLASFDCLVLADSPSVPSGLQPAFGNFARSGKDFIFAGGLAFSQLSADQKPFTDLAFSPAPRYRFKGEFSVQPWNQANINLPPGLVLLNKAMLSGSSALGFAFPKQSEFHPLLEVVDSHGRREAWAIGLLQHRNDEFKGGNWLLAGIEQEEFYRSPSLLGWMLETVRSYSAPRPNLVVPSESITPPSRRIGISKAGVFVRPDGLPFFIVGANYCGPFDAKLGEFFQKDAFSAEVLDAEFAKFHAIGINTLRSFSFGHMGTLEAPGQRVQAIRTSAQRHGIYLLPEIGLKVLLAGPLDITDNAKHAAAVARAYHGEPMLLGYDLDNEPYLTQVGSMTFQGEPSPLVKLRPYETMAYLLDKNMNLAWVERQMQKTDGWLSLPHWLSAETKRELLASVSIWIAYLNEQGGKDSTFPGLQGKIDIQNSGKYAPFLTALNETFSRWLEAMIQAIRSEDPEALITVGYNTALVALPANENLDFINNHIYPKPYTYRDTEISVSTFDRLHQMFPGKPITIGEFGLSNGLKIKGETANYQTQALWELLHYLYPYAHGFGGSMKWSDNDWTAPYIQRYAKWWMDRTELEYEKQFGLFAFDGTDAGSPKPIAWCVHFFSDYLQSNPNPGTLNLIETKNQVLAGFEYRADTAWFYGGEAFANKAFRWENAETKVVMVRWDAQAITLLSTVDMELELNSKTLVMPAMNESQTSGNWQKINLLKGKPVTLTR